MSDVSEKTKYESAEKKLIAGHENGISMPGVNSSRNTFIHAGKRGIRNNSARGMKLGRPYMEFDEAVAQIYDDCKHGRISVAKASREYKIPRSTLRYRLKIYEEREMTNPDSSQYNLENVSDRIVIFGAQAIAFSTYKALAANGYKVLFFVVSDKNGNPSSLENIKVISLTDFLHWCEANDEYPTVYVATPEDVQQEIVDTLKSHDYTNTVCVDSEFFGNLMNEYYSTLNIFHGVEPEKYIAENVAIYQARSEKDKLLKHIYRNNAYTHSVQGGGEYCLRKVS